LQTNASGSSLWSGGFEPFGKDWSGAQAAGEFLRFPGQWEDGAWAGGEIYYNIHRWLDASAGRYLTVDPLKFKGKVFTPYVYAISRPLKFIDTTGLFTVDASCDSLECAPQHFGFVNILRQLKLETQWQCESLDIMITDVALLQCIQGKCRTGKVYCKSADEVPWKDPLNYCNDFNAGGYGRVGEEATLCPGNWTYGVPPGYLGGTVIHEWAHNCGWKHLTEVGVPNPTGGW
jgi:RHS repeat-associated protein